VELISIFAISMRRSKFSEEQKIQILMEKDSESLSTEDLCSKHKISIGTYYIWKRKYEITPLPELTSNSRSPTSTNLKEENSKLRQLYINLSEHNYELAKFLNK
jgi:transposase-like protein